MFGLLPTGQAFAHTSSVTHTTASARPSGRHTPLALQRAQRSADDDSCQFEDCNGQDPSSNGCTDVTQLHPVSVADISGPTGVIGQVRIWESAACGAYFAEVNSLVGAQTETMSIERDAGQPGALSYRSGPADGVGLLSPMVGIIKGKPIRATGQMRYGRIYSATASLGGTPPPPGGTPRAL